MLGLLLLGGVGGGRRLSGQRPHARHASDRLFQLQPVRRAVDRGGDQGRVVIVALFRINRIGFKLDAVITGFAVGAGFSVVENILYLVRLPDYGAGIWMVRGLGTAVMHGTTLAVLAAIAHEFAERETRGTVERFRLPLVVVRPGLPRRGRDPHRLQPVPRRSRCWRCSARRCSPRWRSWASSSSGTGEAQQWLTGRIRCSTARSSKR